MVMVTILKYLESNRNFHTPAQSPWKQNACFRRTHKGFRRTHKGKNYILPIGQKTKNEVVPLQQRGTQKMEATQQSQTDAFENLTGSSELNFFFS